MSGCTTYETYIRNLLVRRQFAEYHLGCDMASPLIALYFRGGLASLNNGSRRPAVFLSIYFIWAQ